MIVFFKVWFSCVIFMFIWIIFLCCIFNCLFSWRLCILRSCSFFFIFMFFECWFLNKSFIVIVVVIVSFKVSRSSLWFFLSNSVFCLALLVCFFVDCFLSFKDLILKRVVSFLCLDVVVLIFVLYFCWRKYFSFVFVVLSCLDLK